MERARYEAELAQRRYMRVDPDNRLVADTAVIIAELGVAMSVFQNDSQLASWAGVCPGTNESAGKRKSGRVPKGNVYLKTGLVEATNAASRARGTYLLDKFYRLKARRGNNRATMAVATDPGSDLPHALATSFLQRRGRSDTLTSSTRTIAPANLVHRLEHLGYVVT